MSDKSTNTFKKNKKKKTKLESMLSARARSLILNEEQGGESYWDENIRLFGPPRSRSPSPSPSPKRKGGAKSYRKRKLTKYKKTKRRRQ